MNLMDLNEARKEYVKRNMAEPKNWERPFESGVFEPIFKIISTIFNFITYRYLNVLLLGIVISLFFKEWNFVVILSVVYIFVYLIKYGFIWLSKNYKNIKTSTTSEGVIIVELEKEGSINDSINQPLPPFK